MTMVEQLKTPYLFFTGKGGVGKTSSASAVAYSLARAGERVLLVSTDPASNLDTVLGTRLGSTPTAVEGVEGLFALNIDPQEAARAYRERVVGPYRDVLPDDSVAAMEEQLSGACTVEIAAFDEFTGLLDDRGLSAEFDRVVFDTAPTGHTLRLLQLPGAWTEFIDTNERGASCLGPLSGLKNQKDRYARALAALSDEEQTTLVLVTRPEETALQEAERTRVELAKQGVENQLLIVNGVFEAVGDDELARALEAQGQQALSNMAEGLAQLERVTVSLKPDNVVGHEALARFFEDSKISDIDAGEHDRSRSFDDLESIDDLADEVAEEGSGLIMMMGKGGVGKTTMAAELAVAVAKRGVPVHLTTTDPAAHLTATLREELENLRVTRIDPVAETEAYRQRVIERSRDELDAEGLALLEEDLRSPCTEEVAVFQAFSKVVFGAKREVTIVDTAPTGHTLLLMDATGSYHRDMMRQTAKAGVTVKTPLMRLQDGDYTKIFIVTLAETTPVQEAAHLQEDLRRADIEPAGWIVNRSLIEYDGDEPVLRARAAQERREFKAVVDEHAVRCLVNPLKW